MDLWTAAYKADTLLTELPHPVKELYLESLYSEALPMSIHKFMFIISEKQTNFSLKFHRIDNIMSCQSHWSKHI